MTPFVDLLVDGERLLALGPLRNDNLGAALIHFDDDPVGIEGFVSN
jgi:hypothetical protein